MLQRESDHGVFVWRGEERGKVTEFVVAPVLPSSHFSIFVCMCLPTMISGSVYCIPMIFGFMCCVLCVYVFCVVICACVVEGVSARRDFHVVAGIHEVRTN